MNMAKLELNVIVTGINQVALEKVLKNSFESRKKQFRKKDEKTYEIIDHPIRRDFIGGTDYKIVIVRNRLYVGADYKTISWFLGENEIPHVIYEDVCVEDPLKSSHEVLEVDFYSVTKFH